MAIALGVRSAERSCAPIVVGALAVLGSVVSIRRQPITGFLAHGVDDRLLGRRCSVIPVVGGGVPQRGMVIALIGNPGPSRRQHRLGGRRPSLVRSHIAQVGRLYGVEPTQRHR